MSLFRFFDGTNVAELPIITNNGKSAYQYAKDGGYTGSEEEFAKKLSDVVNPYLVGSIYQSFDPTSPGDLFGGSWEQLTDFFLLGASNKDLKDEDKIYPVDGKVHGETTVALTIDTMPSHYHTFDTGEVTGSNPNPSVDLFTRHSFNRSMSTEGLDYAASVPHNNMPPYMVVYTWKRIA